uniref:Uncharacterized protein n=1 Tax=Arundo donax TaxID=35708 RepID=A0A0A9CNA0_ARUDO
MAHCMSYQVSTHGLFHMQKDLLEFAHEVLHTSLLLEQVSIWNI